MYEIAKDGITFIVFENQADLIAHCGQDKFQPDDDFISGDSGLELPDWASVLKAVDARWPFGLASMADCKDMLKDATRRADLKDCRTVRQYTVADGDIDIDRYLDGLANYHVQVKRDGNVNKAVATIFIDLTAPGIVSSDDLMWRGAAGLALAELLEEKSYKTEIWTIGCSSFLRSAESREAALGCTMVNLKRQQDVFDPSTLVNNIGGWFYRSVVFTARRTMPNGIDGHCWIPFIPSTKQLLGTVTNDENLIISAGFYDQAGSVEMIRRQLEIITGSADVGDIPASTPAKKGRRRK